MVLAFASPQGWRVEITPDLREIEDIEALSGLGERIGVVAQDGAGEVLVGGSSDEGDPAWLRWQSGRPAPGLRARDLGALAVSHEEVFTGGLVAGLWSSGRGRVSKVPVTSLAIQAGGDRLAVGTPGGLLLLGDDGLLGFTAFRGTVLALAWSTGGLRVVDGQRSIQGADSPDGPWEILGGDPMS